jgi:pyruvate/2-oxoglutarate/acetoin dehydrogenase E1 component
MRKISFREALREALDEEMSRDDKVLLFGEDLALMGGAFGVTKGLLEKFKEERVRDTPISESAIIGTALGAAACGYRPVAEIMFCDFCCCGMDQLVNQVAKMTYMLGGQLAFPLVIRTTCGAGVSAAAQHSQSNEAYFMHTPGLKIACPATPHDAKGLLKSAIRDADPVLFFENKTLYNRKAEVPEEEYLVPLGKANIHCRGSDVSVIATMAMVPKALQAAERLKAKGIEVEVIDLRTLVPLDRETILESVQKTGRVVVAIEEPGTCGVAAEICALVVEEAFEFLKAPAARVCMPDVPIPFNPELERYVIPQSTDIEEAIGRALEWKAKR